MTAVLVVDDDATIRRPVRVVLEAEGYDVFEAPDGRSALAQLRAHPTCLIVLLDLMMPGMDGMALLEAIRAEPSLARRHPLILWTATAGSTLPARLRELLCALAVPVLDKPSRVTDLLAALHVAEQRLTS